MANNEKYIEVVPFSYPQHLGERLEIVLHEPSEVAVLVDSYEGNVSTVAFDKQQAQVIVNYLQSWLSGEFPYANKERT